MTAALISTTLSSDAAAATGSVIPASLPTLSGQGIGRVSILCLVVDQSVARLAIQERLCRQVQRIAAQGAPVTVATIGFGDPVLLARDTLGILVHAAIQRGAGAPSMVLSVRPYRSDPSRSEFFGATPVSIPIDARGAAPDAEIGKIMNQVLPWRR